MFDRRYWEEKLNAYTEQAAHIRCQRDIAGGLDKPKLAAELERVFTEIHTIKEAIKNTPQ